jgi:hypothetical protein
MSEDTLHHVIRWNVDFFRSPAELAVCPRRGSLGSGFCTAASLAKLRRHPAAGTQEAFQKARQINICVNSRKMQP